VYDSSSEAREFVGRDRAEAVAKAAGFFGCPQEDLAIAEPEFGVIAGLGARAVVVAYPRTSRPPHRGGGGGSPEPRPGGREDRGGREPRRDDDGGGRGGRGGRGPRESRDGGGRRDARESRPEREPREFRETREPARPPRADTAEAGPSIGTATSDLGELGAFAKGLVERMELGPFEISETRENESLVVIQVRGAAAQRLVGTEGRTVDAMQLLANQASLRISGDDAPRVVLDVEGDGDQREVYLTRVAERAASRARETGRPVALEAMNPKDRRSVHVALREADGIATMSVGDGHYRQVVVVPDNAPEYEEAKRYEAQSQRESRD
jgi:spoIIIJ-associated protein